MDKTPIPNGNCLTGHDYAKTGGGGYYKYDGRGTTIIGPTCDHSKEYQMLFCRRCGATLEILSRDHSKPISTISR